MTKRTPRLAGLLMGTAVLAALPTASLAITVSPADDPYALANTLFLNVPGLNITSAGLQGITNSLGTSQAGTYLNEVGTYGLPVQGIVLSSGNVQDYGTGPNNETGRTTSYEWLVVDPETGEVLEQHPNPATPEQEALLQPITGRDFHFDAVELDIEFEAIDVSSVTFFATFGSEEWPEYVGSSFIDGFGLYVNGVNVAGVLQSGGVAGDPLLPVNINHPDMTGIAGTELDGILAPNGNPVLRFDVPVLSGEVNRFQIILADASDHVLDTTVYLSSFIPNPDDGGGDDGGGDGGTGEGAGTNEFNPLLPSNPPDPETGAFEISFAETWENFEDGQWIWIDPPVTVGYVYTISGGSLFTSILAPSLAAVADLDGYTVTVGSNSIGLLASQSLNFMTWLGFNPTSFTLSGIDPALALDPTDPAAFPLGVQISTLNFQTTITITPETVDVAPIPLPAGLGLYLLAVAGLGSLVAARRFRSA